jgi:2-keto-4-pentenoate hydratase
MSEHLPSSPADAGQRDARLDDFVDELLGFSQTKRFERKGTLPISVLTLDEAYEVQSRLVRRQIRQGKRAVGFKVGCTSRPIREQFRLAEPVTARLLHPHVSFGDTRLSWEDYVGCAVEAELVFGIGRDVTAAFRDQEEARAAIAFVSPGIEVHNFRFLYGEPTTQELIAGNALHAGLVVGAGKTNPEDLDLEREGVGLFVDGELKTSGISAETMGSPLNSLVWLAEKLVARGEALRAGDLVIPGAPVKLVDVPRGSVVRSCFTSCGEVRADFL